MNEFLGQFLVEARELVEQGVAELLALEQAPSNRDNLDGAFRAFHTLKGGAGIVDFGAMARAVHAAEDVLSDIRAGRRAVTPALISDCLGCLDQVVRWLDAIQDGGELPEECEAEADDVVNRFEAGERRVDEAKESDAGPVSDIAATIAVLEEQVLVLGVAGEGAKGRSASAGRVAVNVLRHLRRPEAADEIARVASEAFDRGDPTALAAAIREAALRLAEPERAGSSAPAAIRSEPLSRTLRVDAEQVNALVKLTGELTVAKNAIAHLADRAREEANPLASAIKSEHARLDRLVGALQRSVLELRVMPLRGVFQRFSRLVREMSETLAKPVRLEIEGEDTEVDKAIIEMLFEPLLHLIRNAIDHGVESAPDRASAGKPAIATLSLRARREEEHVLIEVEDDGAGIDVDRIRKTAAERGLETEATLAAMSEPEILELIFAPGFSTAAQITGLSGRGVGMDVARVAVERLGGRVAVETRVGAGTLITFVLPFSVMLTRVLTVEAGGQTFGVPLDAVVETTLARRDEIHSVGQARAFVFRGKTIPFVELSRLLGRPTGAPSNEATIVVVMCAGLLWGLGVERLGERLEVILRAPDGLLTNMAGIAGTTTLGDGEILLVLDLAEIIR
jgi:two-component system chemotaxis sensor kinase CheA